METPQHIKDEAEALYPDRNGWGIEISRKRAAYAKGRLASQKEIEELREENRKLKGGSSKLLEALKEIHKDIYEYDLEEQFGLEEYDYIKSAIQAYES